MQEYEYVYQVYKEKSFSKAAKNLFISQPALSATIKKIETKLGVQLFERTTTSVTLTEAGEAYIDTARKIMELESDLAVYLEDLSNLNTGRLVLAGTAFFLLLCDPTGGVDIPEEISGSYAGDDGVGFPAAL